MPNAPVKVAVSGAAGQIAYALLFRLAQGDVFGPDTPIDLRLLDLPQAQAALQGVVMELDDCAFPLLTSIQTTDDPIIAFDDIDAAFLVGSRPRAKGMERRDLLAANAAIFKTQGAALNAVAKRSVKVLVVGNPANTNAWVAIQSAPDLPPGAITSMIRLDHNRAAAQFARRAGVPVDAVEKLAVWGNHSPTMFADWSHATVEGQSLAGLINDETWYRDTLIPEVARRGTAVLEARGASSAASAANAICATGCRARTAVGFRWASPRSASTTFPKGWSAVCRRPAATASMRPSRVWSSTPSRAPVWPLRCRS